MSTTPNMSMVLPTDHDTTDTWGAVLNTALTLNDAHDHSAGKGVRITQAGIGLTGDLSFAVHALTNALALDMTPSSAAAVAAYSSALFTNSADNNLYFRNSTGTNVQITAGGALNIASSGGFGGDYVSVGALADFVDANDTYHFYQQLGGGVRQFARMAAADYDLYEYKANPSVGVPTNRVRLKSPAALAASYDLTWLTALPSSNMIIGIDNAGAITAGLAVTMQANQSLTVPPGTGRVIAPDFLHTSIQQRPIDLASLTSTNATVSETIVTSTAIGWSWRSRLLPVRTGDRIVSFSFAASGSGSNYTSTLLKTTGGGATTAIQSFTAGSIPTSNTLSSPYTAVAGERYFVQIQGTTGAVGDTVTDARFTYDHPT